MNAALEPRRVDGACVVEPFVSQGRPAGRGAKIDPFEKTAPNLTVATYFTTCEAYAKENADVVDRFMRAMNKSLDYAGENPDEVREDLLEYTQIPPEAAEAIKLPDWREDLNEPTIKPLSELTKKYGWIEGRRTSTT